VGVLRLRPQFAILRRNELLKMLDGVDMVQHVAALHHLSGRESGVGQSAASSLATATAELASIADAGQGVTRPSTVGHITPATGAPQ
jgi:hypothetical protein